MAFQLLERHTLSRGPAVSLGFCQGRSICYFWFVLLDCLQTAPNNVIALYFTCRLLLTCFVTLRGTMYLSCSMTAKAAVNVFSLRPASCMPVCDTKFGRRTLSDLKWSTPFLAQIGMCMDQARLCWNMQVTLQFSTCIPDLKHHCRSSKTPLSN